MEGANEVWGGPGDNTLSGAGGNDTLYGQNGTDTLSGGRGDDLLRAEPGTVLLTGETPGSDEVQDRANGGANNPATAGDSCFVRAAGTTTACETILTD